MASFSTRLIMHIASASLIRDGKLLLMLVNLSILLTIFAWVSVIFGNFESLVETQFFVGEIVECLKLCIHQEAQTCNESLSQFGILLIEYRYLQG